MTIYIYICLYRGSCLPRKGCCCKGTTGTCSCIALTTLRPGKDGRHSPDDICKCIFLNEDKWVLIKISMKFVSKGPIDNIPALVQIIARRRLGAKPLSEPMMISLLTHICVTRPQCVNSIIICNVTLTRCHANSMHMNYTECDGLWLHFNVKIEHVMAYSHIVWLAIPATRNYATGYTFICNS